MKTQIKPFEKKIWLNIPELYKKVYKGILPAFLICLLIGCFVSYIPGRSMIGFIAKGSLVVLIYSVVIMLVGLNKHEKQYIYHFFKRN